MTALLKKLRKVLETIVHEHGPVWVFGVARRSKSIHRWDVILAASWAERDDVKLKKSLYATLKRLLTKQENEQLGRFVMLDADDPFLDALFQRIGGVHDQAAVHLIGPLLGDESIIEAYVLAAMKPQAGAARQTA